CTAGMVRPTRSTTMATTIRSSISVNAARLTIGGLLSGEPTDSARGIGVPLVNSGAELSRRPGLDQPGNSGSSYWQVYKVPLKPPSSMPVMDASTLSGVKESLQRHTSSQLL